MFLGVATLLCAEVIRGSVAGRIVDALTRNPVSGAAVTDGRRGGTLTDSQGRFVLSGPPSNGMDVIVQHPAYVVFAQAGVPLGTRIEIKLQPSSIQAEPGGLLPLARDAPFRNLEGHAFVPGPGGSIHSAGSPVPAEVNSGACWIAGLAAPLLLGQGRGPHSAEEWPSG
jgi:carboxypeptidase family protein